MMNHRGIKHAIGTLLHKPEPAHGSTIVEAFKSGFEAGRAAAVASLKVDSEFSTDASINDDRYETNADRNSRPCDQAQDEPDTDSLTRWNGLGTDDSIHLLAIRHYHKELGINPVTFARALDDLLKALNASKS